MKKIILITFLPITIVMAGSFVMTKGNPLIKADATTITTSTDTIVNDTTTTYSTTSTSNWTPKPLPTQKFNVLDYGLKGDGITDDSAALKELAKNTSVTNWYFPVGKTFKLYGIVPPAHVTTIWGGGTLKTIYKNVTYPLGVFQISNKPLTHLLIDNINFTYTNTDYEHGEYGAVLINKGNGNSVHNIEIRNSSFVGNSKCPANGITVYGKKENGGTKHINIHDNHFIDIPRAGIEVLHRSDIPTTDGDGIEDVNIFNNIFDFSNSSGWKCAISFSQVRKACLVANNRLINTSWDIEINQAANITIRNNYSTGCKAHFISQGSTGWHGNDVFTIAENWIYRNHFESQTATIHIYTGSKSKYYENFISGGIWSQNNVGDPWDASIGEIYNNTIVKDSSIHAYAGEWTGPASAIKIEGKGGNTNIHDNDIYIKHNGSTGIVMNSTIGVNTHVTNNNIRRTGTDNNCISTGTNATISNNICTANYSNTIPTSRSNAGIQ